MEHDHLNKLSITFQQKDQCEIRWKLAKWFLKNHDFIHVNSTVAGKYNKYKQDDGHLRFPIRTIFGQMSIYLPSPMAYAKIQPQGILGSGEEDLIFKGFYHIWAWGPSWSMSRDHYSNLSFPNLRRLHMKFEQNWPRGSRGEVV